MVLALVGDSTITSAPRPRDAAPLPRAGVDFARLVARFALGAGLAAPSVEAAAFAGLAASLAAGLAVLGVRFGRVAISGV
jgi:hypothetical protein